MDDFALMGCALKLAEKALGEGEFPVGCIISLDGEILVETGRKGSDGKLPSEITHAEILALQNFEKKIPPEKRSRCCLYSTMEPCLMCYAATLLAGIGRIVWAYEDVMGGGTSCANLALAPLYTERKPEIVARFRRNESLALFKRFFANPRTPYWQESLLARYTLETS